MPIYNDLVFTEAIEQVEALIASNNADEITDRMQQIVKSRDLALGCLMLLVLRVKGVDTSGMTGVALAATQPSIRDLVLPPGVIL